MGGTGGNGTLSLNNGGSVYATAVMISTNSTLVGNGTVTAVPGGVNVMGGTITPINGTSPGTLTVVGGLTMTGGTLNILLSGNTNSLLVVTGNATLGGLLSFNTGSFTNAIYTFLSATNGYSGTFASTNNLPTGYQVVYASNSVYLQLISKLGPITTSFAPGGTNAVITGGSTNFIVTVTNSAPTGSDNLVFTGTNSGNTTGTLGSTTVAPQGSTNISGVFAFNGTNVGSNQMGTVTIASTNSIPSSGIGTVSVDVYGHASGSISATNVNLGDAIIGYSPITTNLVISNAAGFNVALNATGSTNGNLSLTGVSSLTEGSSSNAALTLATNQGVGAFTNNVTVIYGDASTLNGANTNLATNTVVVTGAIYGHASGSISTNAVVLQSVHVGYTNAQINLIGISNAVGFRVALQTAVTNSSNGLSLAGVSNVATNSSSNAALTFATNQGVGSFTNVIGVVYGDSSSLSGNLAQVGTNFLTVSGLVYSGQSTWTAGSGNWSSFSSWDTNGGTPGLDGALSVNDTATFGINGSGTVTLNTNATLSSLTFSNASAPYTIIGSGTVTLQTAGLLNNLAGSNTIGTVLNLATNVTLTNNAMLTVSGGIAGNGGLSHFGNGTTTLSGNNSYSGGTTLNAGKIVTTATTALGSGKVVLNGGTLEVRSMLNITSLDWTGGQIAMPTLTPANGIYLNLTDNTTNALSITPGSTNVFDLTGSFVTIGVPTELLASTNMTTNNFSTNNFSAMVNTGYAYQLSIYSNALWIDLISSTPTNGLIVYPTTTTISNTATYNSATFLSNGILDVTSSGNLTITTNVEVSNNSTVN